MLRKQFRDTQRVSFMLDKTREPLFPNWKQKKNIFGRRNWIFSFEKCRIELKNVKGGTLWGLLTYILLQSIKKMKGDPLMRSTTFRKKTS